MDVTDLKPGEHFPDRLARAANDCSVMVAVIGHNWLGEGSAGQPARIMKEDDMIRIELRIALADKEKTVIPVLISRAPLPRPDQLPLDLKDLPNLNVARLRDETLGQDLVHLVNQLLLNPYIKAWSENRKPVPLNLEYELPRWKAVDADDADDYIRFLRDFPGGQFDKPAWRGLCDLTWQRLSVMPDLVARLAEIDNFAGEWLGRKPSDKLSLLRQTTLAGIAATLWQTMEKSCDREQLAAFVAQYGETPSGIEARTRDEFLRREVEAWSALDANSDIDAFRQFLDVFADGAHADAARTRIEDLEWQVVRQSTDLATVRRFLNRYRSGRYAADAEALIEWLKAAEAAWQAVNRSTDIAALATFRTAHPNSRFDADAAARIALLETEAADWRRIEASNRIQDFEAFLLVHPSLRFAGNARSKVLQLTKLEGDAWPAVRDGRDIERITEFMAMFPNGRFANEAALLKGKLAASHEAWLVKAQTASQAWLEGYLVRPGDMTVSDERDARARLNKLKQDASERDRADRAAAEELARKKKLEDIEQARLKARADAATAFESALRSNDPQKVTAAFEGLTAVDPVAGAAKKPGFTLGMAQIAAQIQKDDGAWNRISSSQKKEDFEAYLKTFPLGRHADAARAKIKSLDSDIALVFGCGFLVLALIAGLYFFGGFSYIWATVGELAGWLGARVEGKIVGLLVLGALAAGAFVLGTDVDNPIFYAVALWFAVSMVYIFFWDQTCATEHGWFGWVEFFPKVAVCYVHAVTDIPVP